VLTEQLVRNGVTVPRLRVPEMVERKRYPTGISEKGVDVGSINPMTPAGIAVKWHWARECRSRRADQETQPKLLGVVGSRRASDVYVKIRIAGRERSALLDTGFEKSCIARKYVAKAKLSPTSEKLYAVNGTEIPVSGLLEISFRVGGVATRSEFLVSEHIDEMMLGVDWLTADGCCWRFDRRTLTIGGREVNLFSRPARFTIRRIYVVEDTVVQPKARVSFQ